MCLPAASSLLPLPFCSLEDGSVGLGPLCSPTVPLLCILFVCMERSNKIVLTWLTGGFDTCKSTLSHSQALPGVTWRWVWDLHSVSAYGQTQGHWFPRWVGGKAPSSAAMLRSRAKLCLPGFHRGVLLSLQYGRYIRSALRQEKGLSAIADLLTHDSERVVKAASGALRNLAVDLRNKELIGESCRHTSHPSGLKLPLDWGAEDMRGHSGCTGGICRSFPRETHTELLGRCIEIGDQSLIFQW